MNIPYYLRDLPITDDPNDKSGKVEQRGILDESDVLDEMLKRGTGLTRQEILGVTDMYTDVLSELVQSGFIVNTRLANFRPGITGKFKGATDPFDPARHRFHALISEGIILKKRMGEATGERITVAIPGPVIIQYVNHATSEANRSLTPGSIGEIIGEALKFEEFGAGDGIFFIREDDDSETRVGTISRRTEGSLMFLIPAELTAGDYFLEVRRSYTSPTDVRTSRLNATLTVS